MGSAASVVLEGKTWVRQTAAEEAPRLFVSWALLICCLQDLMKKLQCV